MKKTSVPPTDITTDSATAYQLTGRLNQFAREPIEDNGKRLGNERSRSRSPPNRDTINGVDVIPNSTSAPTSPATPEQTTNATTVGLTEEDYDGKLGIKAWLVINGKWKNSDGKYCFGFVGKLVFSWSKAQEYVSGCPNGLAIKGPHSSGKYTRANHNFFVKQLNLARLAL